jgi:NAD(P)-dependent dehydrogenase (short-subunit alcohol dehydrogenase family)
MKLWDTEAGALDRMLTLNLRAGFVLSRAAAEALLPAGKGAAVAMMDSLAGDLKGTGVRANSVRPSIIDTPANP